MVEGSVEDFFRDTPAHGPCFRHDCHGLWHRAVVNHLRKPCVPLLLDPTTAFRGLQSLEFRNNLSTLRLREDTFCNGDVAFPIMFGVMVRILSKEGQG